MVHGVYSVAALELAPTVQDLDILQQCLEKLPMQYDLQIMNSVGSVASSTKDAGCRVCAKTAFVG